MTPSEFMLLGAALFAAGVLVGSWAGFKAASAVLERVVENLRESRQ